MKATSTIFRFSTHAEAQDFARHAATPMGIVLGDDDRFWVVTAKDHSRFLEAGYMDLTCMPREESRDER